MTNSHELDPHARAQLKELMSATEPPSVTTGRGSERIFRRRGDSLGLPGVVGEPRRNRSTESVCADYLYKLYQASLEQLSTWTPAWVRDSPRKFILTVPAIWTDAAKNATKQCARRAFGQNADIELIAEPQAAAIYALSHGQLAGRVCPGDNYIVCDAGGGTVDLITYRIKRVNPLELVESIPGAGDTCGSIFLNRAFENLLRKRLGSHYTNPRTEQLENWLKDVRKRFEVEIKQGFTGEGDERSEFLLPPELYGAGIEGTEENSLIITPKEIKEDIFEPTITRIRKLIRAQINSLDSRGHSPWRLAGILLVGGLSQSRYLFNRVRSEFSKDAETIQTPNAWASVVLGALCWGMNNQTVTGRVLTRCYGQEVYLKWSPDCGYPRVLHPFTGEPSYKAMKWFVCAGREVSVGHPAEFPLVAFCNPERDADLKITLLAWNPSQDQPEPPDARTKECYKVGDMTINLDEPRRRGGPARLSADGRNYYQELDFKMQLLFSSEIEFRAIFEGLRRPDSISARVWVSQRSSSRCSISATPHLLCQALIPAPVPDSDR
ncbi:hypothetical protein BDV28DRAFT_154932 [Aspergillus coremiiformis]|uniref:Actin-like ATPase domain-containing protein n=1 Tax=Aspergillus coremiiformis TaxID=138285 RepID=A0A5N6ZEI4_9EURO|nr:hypothetical protein BDV28DRAFT_154932 [Aspergillus coremiiformis]